MKLKTLTAVAVTAAFATSLAYAGDNKAASSGSTAQPTFQSLDKNKDGSLSKDEVKSWSGAKDFAKLDANHDGKLSSQEFAASSQLSPSSAAGGTSSSKSTKKY